MNTVDVWVKGSRVPEIDCARIRRTRKLTRITLPAKIFSPANITQWIGILHSFNNRIEKLNLGKLSHSLQGPCFGIQGIRQILEVYHRPLLACQVQTAESCRHALLGGAEVVFCSDVKEIVQQASITEHITNKHALILPEITASSGAMLERAQTLSQHGAIGFSTSVAGGLDGVLSLRTYSHSVISAQGILPDMSEQVSVMLSALAGADIVQASEKNDLKPLAELLSPKKMPFVRVRVKHLKDIPELVKQLGNNILLELTSLEHPEGIRAARQAIEATMHEIPLKKYAELHEELMQALN